MRIEIYRGRGAKSVHIISNLLHDSILWNIVIISRYLICDYIWEYVMWVSKRNNTYDDIDRDYHRTTIIACLMDRSNWIERKLNPMKKRFAELMSKPSILDWVDSFNVDSTNYLTGHCVVKIVSLILLECFAAGWIQLATVQTIHAADIQPLYACNANSRSFR